MLSAILVDLPLMINSAKFGIYFKQSVSSCMNIFKILRTGGDLWWSWQGGAGKYIAVRNIWGKRPDGPLKMIGPDIGRARARAGTNLCQESNRHLSAALPLVI
jgi:hypothetical protein